MQQAFVEGLLWARLVLDLNEAGHSLALGVLLGIQQAQHGRHPRQFSTTQTSAKAGEMRKQPQRSGPP